MARPEPVVIPSSEGGRLVEIRQTVARAFRNIALHEELTTTKANGRPPDGLERPTQRDGPE